MSDQHGTENTVRATQLKMATVYAFQLGSGRGVYCRIFRCGSLLWYVPRNRAWLGNALQIAAPHLSYALVFLIQ